MSQQINITHRKFINYVYAFLLALLATLAPAEGGHLSFSWQEPTWMTDGSPVGGSLSYRVHYGLASGNYQWTVDVGTNASCTLDQLEDGTVYYLAVKACSDTGVESGFSEEIVWKSPLPSVVLTLGWSAPLTNVDGSPIDDLGGFTLHYGTESGTYTHHLDAGLVQSVSVPGLQRGKTYYFSVSAYDALGNQSDYGEEMAWCWGDRDLDGIKDAWETAHFGSVNHPAAQPQADTDGDGRNTFCEFVQGSNPTIDEPVFLPLVVQIVDKVPCVMMYAYAALDSVYDGYRRYYAIERLNGGLAGGQWESLPGYERIFAANQSVLCPVAETLPEGNAGIFRYRVWLETN